MSQPEFKKLGELLREKREALNLTFQQVADFLGRSRTSYSGLEKGIGRLHLDEGVLLCDLLKISWGEMEVYAQQYAYELKGEKSQ